MVWASFPAFAVGYFTPNLQHSGVYHTTGQGRKRHYHGIWWIIRPAPTNSFRAGFLLIRPSRQAASSCSPCAGYLAHPFSKETVFTLEFRRCDPSFPAFLPGSRSLQEGHGCPDHDGFSVCSPSAIPLLSRCDRLSPAMLLCISEAVFRCAGYSTFNIRS